MGLISQIESHLCGSFCLKLEGCEFLLRILWIYSEISRGISLSCLPKITPFRNQMQQIIFLIAYLQQLFQYISLDKQTKSRKQLSDFIKKLTTSHLAIISGNLINLQQTMSVLQALAIAGFRSYSPDALQKIEFQTPLTLIWGKNGSGKTTIIEVLKYITTGALPPSCDKGKNFVMDPKMIGQTETIGDTRLKFRAFNGRAVLAKRRALLTVSLKGVKFQSIEQTLKTKDQKGEMFEINHHCSQIQKQIPQLLGISKSVLENIVFCHQDESLWPFSDSANLKTIFDQMFQTKRYTKIIESFWQQQKEYSKEVKQLKKALEYMKRLYDQDNRKKRLAIIEMQKLGEESIIVSEMRQKIEFAELQIKNQKASNDRRFQLIMKRGNIQEKINNGNRILNEYKIKAQAMAKQFYSQFGRNLSSKSSPKKLAQQVQLLQRKKGQLQLQLEESQNVNIFTQKQMQILGQIKRAKQYLPEIRKEDSEERVIVLLRQKCQTLQRKKNQLVDLRRQCDKIALPNILQISLSQSDYRLQKEILNKESQSHQSVKFQILSLSSSLYKKVDSRRSRQFEPNLQEKLKEVQVKIKMKNEQLQKYQAMPSVQSIKQKKMRISFAGIQFQENIYQYCSQKKKCFVCSKPITQTDLRSIKSKCDKSTTKSLQKIKQLESQQSKQDQTIDPQEMVLMLTQQIAKAQQVQQKLSAKYKEYATYKQQMEQIQLNEKILNYLKKAGLEREANDLNKTTNGSVQQFVQLINQYENMKIRVEMKARDINLYEQRTKKNKLIMSQRKAVSQKLENLKAIISKNEQQTKSYEMIQNIYKRLTTMLKGRGKNYKNKNTDSQSNPEDLEKQIYFVSVQINSLNIEKQYCEIISKCALLEAQIQKMMEQFKQIDRQLRQIDQKLQEYNKKLASYNKLNLEYVSKKRQIDLKTQVAYQEYHKSVEKEYLIKKMEITTKEGEAKDLQNLCKVMENSISRFHKQKMDEVNRFLAEIWRQVYHGEDINFIQIQTSIEEDPKRRKNYNYSIVMQKYGQGDKKMDMKGRCSMGQKVLASIVIRLALAQVFANTARILALDEPTTNLDREHIVNLAHQLGRLLQLNECKYLQMIIISHDLEFIKLLQKYTASYYEVSRDQKKFSILTKKDISQIFQQH